MGDLREADGAGRPAVGGGWLGRRPVEQVLTETLTLALYHGEMGESCYQVNWAPTMR